MKLKNIIDKATVLQNKINDRFKTINEQKKMYLICLSFSLFYLMIMSNLFKNTFLDVVFLFAPPLLILCIPFIVFKNHKKQGQKVDVKEKNVSSIFDDLESVLNEY